MRMKYRKKPVVVEAVKFGFTPRSQRIAREFVGKDWIDWELDGSKVLSRPKIKTLEGDMEVGQGDYIIKGVQGEFYPCKPDIFEATYEKAD